MQVAAILSQMDVLHMSLISRYKINNLTKRKRFVQLVQLHIRTRAHNSNTGIVNTRITTRITIISGIEAIR